MILNLNIGSTSNQIDEVYQDEYDSDSSISIMKSLHDVHDKIAKLHQVYPKRLMDSMTTRNNTNAKNTSSPVRLIGEVKP